MFLLNTGKARSSPRDRRSRGKRETHAAFRRNTAGRRPRVPSGTRFTGRPGRSAPLTGRGIEPRDLRSRPVEDPGCRKAPGSRAARAERPSRGGGYAITGEKPGFLRNAEFLQKLDYAANVLKVDIGYINREAYIAPQWAPRVSKKRGGKVRKAFARAG